MRRVPGSRGAASEGATFRYGVPTGRVGSASYGRVFSAARPPEVRHVSTFGPRMLEVTHVTLGLLTSVFLPMEVRV